MLEFPMKKYYRTLQLIFIVCSIWCVCHFSPDWIFHSFYISSLPLVCYIVSQTIEYLNKLEKVKVKSNESVMLDFRRSHTHTLILFLYRTYISWYVRISKLSSFISSPPYKKSTSKKGNTCHLIVFRIAHNRYTYK